MPNFSRELARPAQVPGLPRALRDRGAWGGRAAGGAQRGAARDAVADDPAVAGGGKLGDRIFVGGILMKNDWLVVWNWNFMFPCNVYIYNYIYMYILYIYIYYYILYYNI